MACFLVPTAEAVITSAVKKKLDKRKNPFAERLGKLNTMLWGGSALLCFEHIWHGEISLKYPFLTAAASPEQTEIMIREMATSGVGMALIVTAVWAGITVVSLAIQRKQTRKAEEDGAK